MKIEIHITYLKRALVEVPPELEPKVDHDHADHAEFDEWVAEQADAIGGDPEWCCTEARDVETLAEVYSVG